MKWNKIKYILSLLLLLFIIILFKKTFIKEGIGKRRGNTRSMRRQIKRVKREYKLKYNSSNPYQNQLDYDQGMLVYYQSMLEEQKVQYSDAIKNGSNSELVNQLEINMTSFIKSIDYYEKKIVKDKELLLANTPSLSPVPNISPTTMTPTTVSTLTPTP
jgi:preprotein translocase subunit SecF